MNIPRAHIALATLSLALLALGCTDENGTPSVGTGSAGGNPLVLAFDTEDSARQPLVSWSTPELNIGEVTATLLDPEGVCAIIPDEPIPLEESILSFDRTQSLEFEPPYPCKLEFRPPPGEPLFLVDATVSGQELELDLLEDIGIRVNVERLDLLQEAADNEDIQLEAVAVFEIDDLIDNLELTDLVELLTNPSDELTAEVLENLANSIQVYLDPTPGDGELTEEERVEANLFATFEILQLGN